MNTREIDFWIGADNPKISPEHFNEIVATASDIAIVISVDGDIETVVVNPLNQTLGRLDHWINRNMVDFLSDDSVDRFNAVLEEFRSGQLTLAKSVEINHFDNANWDFPIRYTFHMTGHDGTILMLGRDLRPIAELQQRLVKAQLALEKDYESHRDFETRYRVVMEAARDPLLMVEASTGKIVDLNANAARTLEEDAEGLMGLNLAALFVAKNPQELLDSLISSATSGTASGVELTSRKNHTVMVEPILFRAGGDRTLLCRIVSDSVGDASAAEIGESLNALFRDGSDAVVFTDDKGMVRSANEAFLTLCDQPQLADVKGRALSDFLARGAIDLKVLLESASLTGRMRMYASRLLAQHGSQIPVEISATALPTGSKARFAFVLRDASRADLLREAPTASSTSDDQMRNVVDLVGASPLKDIVSATTDVIEKMCIEAAVKMTGNNRVAAAEMLGLSRQSLYVKLRKYGLLEKSKD